MLNHPKVQQNRIISKGAEATIVSGEFFDRQVIFKVRNPKIYRAEAIDQKLRKERTIQEVRVLSLARLNGIPTPIIYDLDKSNWTIIMSFIEGKSLKEKMGEIQLDTVFNHIGRNIGKLHNLNIIHGDLTTSNIIISDDHEQIHFIDFGLGYVSTQIEDKAVDMLVVKHILESTHVDQAKYAMTSLLNGYRETSEQSSEIITRMGVVENRVRYRSHEIE